jgi:hypothetical protein
MNLFLSTRRLTDRKEDHLTEFLAAGLELDSAFRDAWSSLVLHPYAARNRWDSPRIAEVSTQCTYADAGCRPDLVLKLRDSHVIACEHKIEAPETLGKEGTNREGIEQLERYLELPIHGLAYFRWSWLPPSDVVLRHSKYIRPSNREHFLWSDLYSALQQATTETIRWLCEGFQHLGFTPPHPAIGELSDSDLTVRAANRENFAKFWQSARSALHEMGWKVTTGSSCELYLGQNERSVAEWIYVSPLRNNGRLLLIRVTPRDSHDRAQLADRLAKAAERISVPVELERLCVPRVEGKRDVVDLAISLADLLSECTTTEAIERKLSAYVLPLICAIEGGEQEGTRADYSRN